MLPALADASGYGRDHALACLERINAARAMQGLEPLTAPDDSEQTTDLLTVYANHGRWVVDCLCGSAQLASRTDPRFFCVECRNAWALGKWVGIDWPAQAADIEALLVMRPQLQTQNWTPGETVLSLAQENADHGVGAR